MFTGIIEEIGRITRIQHGNKSVVLSVQAEKVLEGTRIGDSIAVNGICLTVTGIQNGGFNADVMAETLRRSSLGSLGQGDGVNLERAMAADGRFGGHIVSGHIDGTGTIASKKPEGNAVWIEIETPQTLLRYIVEKGSIAIDGVSLTVARLTGHSFSVSLIPHTGTETVLLQKRNGDVVNLENDIVGKYVERFLMMPAVDGESENSHKIDMVYLAEHGFC